MNELQSVTDIDEVIKYTEREADGCHQMASAYHTDEGVYLHEETRFQYKAILWENIHEWLEELKELRKKQRPHGEWIPCSERLPERDELVLVSFKTGGVHLCKYLDDGSENPWWSYIDDCCAWNNTVDAWMPLPEPYKEEGEEK